MTLRRVCAEATLIGSVVLVATATGLFLGLRALDRWLSQPSPVARYEWDD